MARTNLRELTGDERETLVNEAKKWLGAPYKRGGFSKDGINCSFLAAAICGPLATAKTPLLITPPMCDWWFIFSKVIPRDELKPGDWIFFRPLSGRPSGRLATHMGMYTGNGLILEANKHAGKVVERRLDKIQKMVMVEKKDPEEIRQWRLENGIP